MELDRIHATAKRIQQRLRCSQQQAEYMASLLALEREVSQDSFQLLAEIHAIHSTGNHSARHAE
jgi:hypothetical protein